MGGGSSNTVLVNEDEAVYEELKSNDIDAYESMQSPSQKTLTKQTSIMQIQ